MNKRSSSRPVLVPNGELQIPGAQVLAVLFTHRLVGYVVVRERHVRYTSRPALAVEDDLHIPGLHLEETVRTLNYNCTLFSSSD